MNKGLLGKKPIGEAIQNCEGALRSEQSSGEWTHHLSYEGALNLEDSF